MLDLLAAAERGGRDRALPARAERLDVTPDLVEGRRPRQQGQAACGQPPPAQQVGIRQIQPASKLPLVESGSRLDRLAHVKQPGYLLVFFVIPRLSCARRLSIRIARTSAVCSATVSFSSSQMAFSRSARVSGKVAVYGRPGPSSLRPSIIASSARAMYFRHTRAQRGTGDAGIFATAYRRDSPCSIAAPFLADDKTIGRVRPWPGSPRLAPVERVGSTKQLLVFKRANPCLNLGW